MSQETVSKCANYEFCGGEKPPGLDVDYCMTCGSWFKVNGFGWDKLTIVDSTEDCDVCMNNTGRKLMFPTNCGHSFCLSCSKNILFWDECRYHLSKVPYGCPPCPKGCDNPVKGQQCYCEEYDTVEDEWKQSKPAEYNKWQKDEDNSIDNSNDVTYGSAKCPMCRKTYNR